VPRALCVELARVTDNRPMQWRMVRSIGTAAGLDDAAADAAIAYAIDREWLIGEGQPAHSICLIEGGRTVTSERRPRTRR
jgi:hypothetical protein